MNKNNCFCCVVVILLLSVFGAAYGDSLNVRSIGSYQFPSVGWNVTVLNGLAYIAADSFGLRICDVSNPAFPVEIGKYRTTGLAQHVFVVNNLAYVACVYPHGLQIIDVSDPHRPSLVSWFPINSYLWNTFVCDTLAFAVVYEGGLRVINVADPALPKEVGHCSFGGNSWWCVVSGDYAYVASQDSLGFGLHIIDISDPVSPYVTGYCHTGLTSGVVVSGNYAYTASGEDGLNIVNVSDVSAPVVVGTYDTPEYAACVAVDGSMAYVVDITSLQVIDVSDPLNPLLAGYYTIPGINWGIDVENGYIFTSGDLLSLQIYEYYGTEGIGSQPQNCSNTNIAKISLKCSPNPFYNQLQAVFNLGKEAEVKLEIFNLIGQKVAANNYGQMTAGRHEIRYQLSNSNEGQMPNGVYLVRLTAGASTAMTKVIKLN